MRVAERNAGAIQLGRRRDLFPEILEDDLEGCFEVGVGGFDARAVANEFGHEATPRTPPPSTNASIGPGAKNTGALRAAAASLLLPFRVGQQDLFGAFVALRGRFRGSGLCPVWVESRHVVSLAFSL